VFSSLNTLIDQLSTLSSQVQDSSSELLQQTHRYYESFRDSLIQGDGPTKKVLLENKVNLIGENGHIYQISQEMARALISKDNMGLQIKRIAQDCVLLDLRETFTLNALKSFLTPQRQGMSLWRMLLLKP
jgi:hypothetical protein